MIQLHPQRMLLKTPGGERESIDLSELESALDRALNICGIQASWLADHILVALQDYAAVMAAADGEGLNKESLHHTLARMLLDAGYADVAASFAEQSRLQDAVAETEHRAAWDRPRVDTLLRQHLKTVQHLNPELGDKVVQRLQTLGFGRVGDTLIIEVARHILAEWGDVERTQETLEAAPRDDWLLAPGFWQTFLPPQVAALVEDEVIEIRQLSDLLPVVRLRFFIPKLVSRIEERPLTDLHLLPALVRAGREIGQAIECLVRQVNRSGKKEYRHPAHLTVIGLDTMLLAEFARESKSSLAKRRSEIVDVITKTINESLQHPLILSFQPGK